MTPVVQTYTEALALGQTHYWTGKPCKRGHVALRRLSNGCTACHRQRQMDKYQEPEVRAAVLRRNSGWKKANPGLVNAACKLRQQQKRKAWLPGHEHALRDIYADAPAGVHVDHIVPLNHEAVCGLHVPWNLQYLTPVENCEKSNKFDPEGYQGDLGYV